MGRFVIGHSGKLVHGGSDGRGITRMAWKRILMVAGSLFLLAAPMSGAANAGTCYDGNNNPIACPGGAPQLTIDDPTAVPGQTVTGTLSGADPASQANGTINSDPISLGSKTVNSNGVATFPFTIVCGFSGRHSLTVDGVSGGAPFSLSVAFDVSGSGTCAGGGTGGTAIPRTGDDSTLPMTAIAIGLLASGAGAVYIARRRRLTLGT
jgi:LPXTG-motif cell wall-anchored protein